MKYRKIDPNSINVAESYQRSVQESHVRHIVKNFNEDAFGVLVVGERDDESLWCVDGQTRRLVAIRMLMREVPCLVFESKGKEHEAAVFRLLNHQRNMSLIDKMRAQLQEGDASTCELVEIVKRCGFAVSFTGARSWPNIRSVSPLWTAYYAGVLTHVLDTITHAWGVVEDVHALQAPCVSGLARFFAKHKELVSPEMLGACLRRYAVVDLIALCNSRQMQGGNREAAMYTVLVMTWNKSSRKKIESA